MAVIAPYALVQLVARPRVPFDPIPGCTVAARHEALKP
jgi:hypothetical protein